MTNVDVSKISFSSNFPTLINYQDATFTFSIPAYSNTFPNSSPPTSYLVYEQQSSAPIDKQNGIAQVLVQYTGGTYLDVSSGNRDDAKYNVRGALSDYFAGTPVGGKNDSQSYGPNYPSNTGTNRFFTLNMFNWFEGSRIYTKVALYYTRTVTTAGPGFPQETITWVGGNIITEATVSLLPF